MDKPYERMVHRAIEQILLDKPAYKTSLNYAVNYCEVAAGFSGEDLRVQVLYILNNITHWRGQGHKEIRSLLKAYTAE